MENFIVSARKYRPATFASVVGQGHITATLRNAILRGQLAHAYLFCGPRGVGKTTCARIFAKAINCLDPHEGEACNACESCLSFNEGRSFSIHELDAASNNSVDDIRSLTEQVRIPPQIGRYSVYIIDEVHMLSAAAFNAFLKTLEEPPAHAIFILATTEKHKILPTILSRCQIYDFNRIRVEDGVGYLRYIAGEEGIDADDESLHLIARKADGGMRDALSMFDKAVSFCGTALTFKEVARTLNVLDYDTYFSVTDSIAGGDYAQALLTFDWVLRNGFSGQLFMAGLNEHFRDLLMCRDPKTLPLLEATGSLLDKYRKQAVRLEPTFLFEAIALMTSLDGSLRTAVNPRLHVELGLMKLCGLGQKKNSLEPDTVALPPLTGETGAASQPEKKQAAEAAAAGPASGNTEKFPPVKPQEKQQENSAANISADANPLRTAPQAGGVPPQTVEVVRETVPSSAPAEAAPKRTISGNSIASILRKPQAVQQDATVGKPAAVDPDTERKVTEAKDDFMKRMRRERPRFAVAFESMRVEGNRLTVVVPSELLHEEIVRNQTEILSMLAEMAGVQGSMILNVEVKSESKAIKPIKVEDKLRYLTELNPEVTALRKALDLEIE